MYMYMYVMVYGCFLVTLSFPGLYPCAQMSTGVQARLARHGYTQCCSCGMKLIVDGHGQASAG